MLITKSPLTIWYIQICGYDGDIATRVYVDAQWTIPATFQFQNGIEIIVMNNAKINASGTMTFIRNSMLTIMEKEK